MACLEQIRLGELLVQHKLISKEQLEIALEQQKISKRKLGRVLMENDFVTEENFCKTLSSQLGIPYVNLRSFQINHDLVKLLKEEQARQFQAIVLERRNNSLVVGMADPTDISVAEGIGRILFRKIDIAVVAEGQLLEMIDRGYFRSQRIFGLD